MHLRPAEPWEVRTTLAALCFSDRQHSAAMTEQGSCALHHIPLACSMDADCPNPPKTLPGFPYRHSTSPLLLPPAVTSTISYTDRRPTSASIHLPCPPTVLRIYHPCQVQVDPAILGATVRISWSGVSSMTAASVWNVITGK